MNLYFLLPALASFSTSVIGLRKEIFNSIMSSYENPSTMLPVFNYLRHQESEPKHENYCNLYKSNMVYLIQIGLHLIDVHSKVLFGTFDDHTGYSLILDDKTTIHIPAIIECTPKYKNTEEPVLIERKPYLYFMVVYLGEEELKFEKASYFNESSTVFIIEEAEIVTVFIDSYNTQRYKRRRIDRWFNTSINRKNDAKIACQNLITYPRTKDNIKPKWEIESGELNMRPFLLRLSERIDIMISGIIACKVNVQIKSDKRTEMKYTTPARIDPPYNDLFVDILGPIRINKTTSAFALNTDLFESLKKAYSKNG